MTTLTEEKVVFAFAKAWNRLVPDGFLDLLAPDARYASQWVPGLRRAQSEALQR